MKQQTLHCILDTAKNTARLHTNVTENCLRNQIFYYHSLNETSLSLPFYTLTFVSLSSLLLNGTEEKPACSTFRQSNNCPLILYTCIFLYEVITNIYHASDRHATRNLSRRILRSHLETHSLNSVLLWLCLPSILSV